MSESNIIQLQKLFDECIYSTLDEEKLRSIAFDSQLVENNLEWDKIYKYFPRKEDFYASLKYMARLSYNAKMDKIILPHIDSYVDVKL